MRIKAVVFDFDGTLLDTESCAFEAFRGIYAEYGCELELERWALGIGTSGGPYDPYADLQSLAGRPLDLAALKARFEAELMERADALKLRPGVPEMLEEARRLGLAVGLASSSSRAWIERHLGAKGIRGYFTAIRTKDDVEKVKPDPALYRLAALDLGVRPEEAAAFEDSANGLKAAKAAGLRAVVVPNPVTSHMDFAGAGADLIVGSLEGRRLVDLLGELA